MEKQKIQKTCKEKEQISFESGPCRKPGNVKS
jgi:hypothetical protein